MGTLAENEPKKRLYQGVTIMVNPKKNTITLYSKDLGRIGKGANNTANKCIKLSFKLREGIVVSKGRKRPFTEWLLNRALLPTSMMLEIKL